MNRRGVGPPVRGLPPTHIEIRHDRFLVPAWAEEVNTQRYSRRVEKCLLVELQGDKVIALHKFSLEFPYLILGRDPAGSHIFVGHDSVSPQHAAVVWNGNGQCVVLNLESSTGVKLRGRSIPAGTGAVIFPQDAIVLGKAPRQFKLHIEGVHNGKVVAPDGETLHVSPRAHTPPVMTPKSPLGTPRRGDNPPYHQRSPVPPRLSPAPPMHRDRRGPYIEQHVDRRCEPPPGRSPRDFMPPEEHPGYHDVERGGFHQGGHAYHREEQFDQLEQPRQPRPRSAAFPDDDSYRRRGPRRDPRRSDYDQPENDHRW